MARNSTFRKCSELKRLLGLQPLLNKSRKLHSVTNKAKSSMGDCAVSGRKHTFARQNFRKYSKSTAAMNVYEELQTENSDNENATTDDEDQTLKLKILENALQYVPQFGWTVEALAAGAEEEGLPPVAHGVISRGPVELVEHFSSTSTAHAISEAREYFDEAQKADQHLGMTDKIKFATRKRLEMIVPHTDSWPQAMALGALPQNAPSTMKSIGDTIDSIWTACGDYSDSSSTSYYTKRGMLSGIYISTEMYMLTDTSKDFKDTWDFLDRQIDTVISLSADIRHIPQVTGTVNNGLTSLFSTVASMAMDVMQDRSQGNLGGSRDRDVGEEESSQRVDK